MRLADLAQQLNAELAGPADIEVRGVAGLTEAGEGDLAFVADDRHLKDLAGSRASAFIVPQGAPQLSVPALRVRNPRLAFARAIALFHVRTAAPGGISGRASIGKDVVIGADATVHPGAFIGDGARIGSRVTIFPGAFIGAGVVIGDDCTIYPNVTVREGVTVGSRVILHPGAVIGSDGFGFVTDGGVHHKIPQVGGVVIGDDVEIGANSTVDRATLGTTVIGKGTKIDNQVQVAHNVVIGEHCLLAAQVGIAGSTSLGKYVVMGGQAGAGDHLTIGDQVMAGGGTGITRDIEAGKVIAGHPALPLREWLKVQASLPKLPELKRLVAQLERRIEELERKS